MPDKLKYEYNPDYEKQRNATARLLKDCADAANAVFCAGGCHASATSIDARSALVNDFGYSNNAVFRLRSSHPINLNNVWIDYLRTNLDAGKPVLYASLGFGDAHAWVCDGYGDDGNGNSHENVYFHFNFGWNGDHDGWYTLNGLSGVGYYNISQEAVFNIYPNGTQNYCNFTLPLWLHYHYWNSMLGFPVPFAHLMIPQTATVLESVPNNLGFPTSWHTIESGEAAVYTAHEEIRLLPGFHAKAGSTFIARIEPCLSCQNIATSTLLLAQGGNPNESGSFSNFDNIIPHEENTLQVQNPTTGTHFVVIILKDGSVFTQKMVIQR